MNRTLLAIGLGFVTLWDTVTTVYGTHIILGNGTIQFIMSILFGLIISGFLINTLPIIKNPKEDFITVGAKVLWFLAICYDLFTAFEGNMDLVLNNIAGDKKIIIAIGITIFICSAPIGLSKIIFDRKE